MNNRKRAGIATAALGIVAFMAFLNSGSPTSIVNWPVETYMGLAFTIGWLSNMPIWLAYVLAAIVLILIIVGLYKVGGWVYGLVAGRR